MKTTTLVRICHVCRKAELLFILLHCKVKENRYLFLYRVFSMRMIEIPAELQQLFANPVGEGARRIYRQGMQLFEREDKRENGAKMITAAIGDAPALATEAMAQAAQYTAAGNSALSTRLMGAVGAGIHLAVDAEYKRLEHEAESVVRGRHVLDLTITSGQRYSEASMRSMDLNRAATVYIGQLEALLHSGQEK